MFIAEAYPKDAGSYVLCAKNSVGLAFTSCDVSVKGRLPNDLSDSEMVVQVEPIKPSVKLPLRDVCTLEGKLVRLDCIITGQPEPEVIWYHEGLPVKESADVQLLFQGDRCSLVIQEAVPEDMGEYKVVAINSAGEASSNCRLVVQSEIASAQQNGDDAKEAAAPRFEKLLCDILANEGDTISFECSAVGKPMPSIKWLLNNVEIGESDRVRFQQSDDGRVALILKNVTNDDKGVYTVKARNDAGEVKCFSHLIVKSVNANENGLMQNQMQRIDERTDYICPTFRERFDDKVVNIDEPVKFECIIAGKPTPKVKWLYNDRPVQGKNFLTSTSGDRQVLTVPAVTHDSVGKISCSAENDVGKAACVAYLNLVGDAAPPSFEEVKRYTEEYNTESSNVTIKRQSVTTSRTSQISSYQTDGGLAPVNIRHTISAVQKSIDNSLNDRPAPELPSNELVLRSARKNTAPRFISPLMGKILDQGASATIEAIVDGFPGPDIVVLKNDAPLTGRDNVTITRQHNKIIIELRNVTTADAGRYSCSATNSMGNALSTADIVVKSEYD